ncbi:MAG TPA: glycosyltransferase family 2 protein [Jatrophihabitantaceae bacterium]|nr:glycosyltransferase family 2 protein [Jatrophihabitantaceae bacterium]
MSEILQIVIPMAGRGTRFTSAGYEQPKPLIDVVGKPMIERVIENLTPRRRHRFVFIVQRDHLDRHGIGELLARETESSVIVPLDAITAGAACTVLEARAELDPDQPLMIANCDQWLDIDIDDYLAASDFPGTDGLIMTMPASDPKWSYVGLDSQGLVTRVVEKQVISDHATVGVYNFAATRLFLDAADQMIAADKRVNGEFYVAPVYNELIAGGAAIGVRDIGSAMWGLGTPADLEAFLAARLITA